jgi:phosphatidylinositol alpha-1,6-mannosyltransferase
LFIFSFDYPPNGGGIARLCATIATGFVREHQSVAVLTQKHPKQGSAPSIDALVNTTRVQWRRPWREWDAFRHLKALRGSGPYLSGIWYPEGLVATLAGVRPHIIMAYGAELFPPVQRWRRPIWRRLQKYILESADLVIADSHYTERLVHAVAPAAHVVAVPLAVDHQFFAPGDRAAAREKWQVGDGRVLCSVSRVRMFKGHDTVLQALAALPPQERDQITYLVAGSGPDLNELKDLAHVLGVEQRVRWLGFVPDEDLPTLYRAADLFVLATREQPEQRAVEGFGLVFLEAQACATPVVGTRTGGIEDAIAENEGGWLIDQDDAAALTAILHELIADPAAFAAMGQIARRRIERKFTWDDYFLRFKQALHTAGIAVETSTG